MLPTNRVTTHPGDFVRENLEELGWSQVDFAKHCGISLQRLNEIINGKRGITAETAWLFGQAFGISAEFWMNLQTSHDLTKSRPPRKIPPIKSRAA
jgi:addiction module HigA family antidote